MKKNLMLKKIVFQGEVLAIILSKEFICGFELLFLKDFPFVFKSVSVLDIFSFNRIAAVRIAQIG